MFEALIKAIQDGVRTEKIGDFYTRQVYHRPCDPLPDTLETRTLQSIVDFVDLFDIDKDPGLLVHIESPVNIHVLGGLNESQQRPHYLLCRSPITPFRFDNYHLPESFIVGLLSNFDDAGDRAKLLQIVGNLRDETIKTQVDDGITQIATVRQGVARVAEVEITNPVKLAPIRTFVEVEQPISNFVFRMRKTNSGVECGLFEADGGRWKLEAIQNIRDWLAPNLPSDIPIIG